LGEDKSVEKFRSEDSEVRVIMLSMDKSAAGTNLIEATHIILFDPPGGSLSEAHAIERQAIGRAVRQGQNKSVTVLRFIVNNTIEHDRFTDLQLLRDSYNLEKEDARLLDLDNNANQWILGFPPGNYRIGGRKLKGRGTAWFEKTLSRADIEANFIREGWELVFSVDDSCNVTADSDSVRKSIKGTFSEDGELEVSVQYVNGTGQTIKGSYEDGEIEAIVTKADGTWSLVRGGIEKHVPQQNDSTDVEMTE